jgi:2-methylcitrate dehydratase PrpD
VITAVAVGYDVQARIGNAVSPSVYVDRPFLPPATLGTFGAAAVTAKLLGLGAQETLYALGTAAFLTPVAIFENFARGAPAKELGMGWAAMCGIMAVGLARQGFIGARSWLEGPQGFAVAAADHYDMDRLMQGLGNDYEILRTGIKPYACCRQHHTAIDATLEIRERQNPRPEEIDRIVLRTFNVASRGDDPEPTTIAGAKYSAPYSISVAMIEGGAWREQYALSKIQDERIKALARRVEVVADPDLDALYDVKWPSIVEVYMRDGRVCSARWDLPKGEPEHPTSDEELKEKFLSLACDGVSSERAEAIYRIIRQLESLPDTRELTSLLREE